MCSYPPWLSTYLLDESRAYTISGLIHPRVVVFVFVCVCLHRTCGYVAAMRLSSLVSCSGLAALPMLLVAFAFGVIISVAVPHFRLGRSGIRGDRLAGLAPDLGNIEG